jgi:prophage antirepressor-like protein
MLVVCGKLVDCSFLKEQHVVKNLITRSDEEFAEERLYPTKTFVGNGECLRVVYYESGIMYVVEDIAAVFGGNAQHLSFDHSHFIHPIVHIFSGFCEEQVYIIPEEGVMNIIESYPRENYRYAAFRQWFITKVAPTVRKMQYGGMRNFKFDGMQDVRVASIENKPWFVAKDVCDVLGIQNVSQAVNSLREFDVKVLTRSDMKNLDAYKSPEISTIYKIYSTENKGLTNAEFDIALLTFISEPGLYTLIFRSNKPAAEKFRYWVFDEVLPSIREKGYFIQDATLDPNHRDEERWQHITNVLALKINNRLLRFDALDEMMIKMMVGQDGLQDYCEFLKSQKVENDTFKAEIDKLQLQINKLMKKA